jgi:hypothetical protein
MECYLIRSKRANHGEPNRRDDAKPAGEETMIDERSSSMPAPSTNRRGDEVSSIDHDNPSGPRSAKITNKRRHLGL